MRVEGLKKQYNDYKANWSDWTVDRIKQSTKRVKVDRERTQWGEDKYMIQRGKINKIGFG